MAKSGFSTVNVVLPLQLAKDLVVALTHALENTGGGKTKNAGASQQPAGKNVTGKTASVTGKSANVTGKRSVTGKQTKSRTGKR